MQELDLLILGAGWTATFLIPLLKTHHPHLLFAATTTTGRPVANHPTLPFTFDPSSPDQHAVFARLPRARHILITFPLKGPGPSAVLARTYAATHGDGAHFRFIQLGSTGIWQNGGGGGAHESSSPWMDRKSAFTRADARAVAEEELIGLGGCVLNLCGLWGGERDIRHWVERVGPSKEVVRGLGSVHMIHGVDVARVIVALLDKSEREGWEGIGKGQRWMVTDGFVYDWWSLFASWAEDAEQSPEPIKQAKWVYELMEETDVRALPRSMEALGRAYDSRELWKTLGITPLKGGLGL